MEPVLKAGPSASESTSSPTLPESDVQGMRNAIASAGGRTVVEINIPVSVAPAQTAQPNAQVLITIIQGIPLGPTRGGFNPSTDSNPLLDALRALRESGFIGPTLDKGDSYRPSGPIPSHGSAPRGTWQERPLRPHHEHHRPARDTHHRTEEPRKTESAQRENSRGEDRPTRPETPQEQRLREALEKAIVQYLERATEPPPGTDRPAAQARVERPTAPGVSFHQTPPSIDPERAPQTPPSIVTPAIRDVLNDTRNDTARLLQQLLGADPNASRPSPQPTQGTTETSPGPSLNPALTEARAGITERLTQLRDALQVTIERTSPQPISAPERIPQTGQAILQQGDFTRVEAPVYNARSQSSIQSESRAGSDLPRASSQGLDVPTIGISVGPLRATGQGREEPTTLTHEKASNLLDALSKAAQKILSVESLRKIEYAAETAVLTAAAAIALGVMGSEVVLRELLALSEELLKRLRGEKNLGESGEQEVVEVEQLVRELEEACADRGVETINQPAGLVADIPGILKDNSSGLPLEGVEIDGGALGVTFTNAQGEFIFRNVPHDEGFAVVARQDGYSFFPNPAVGTVSATTYLTIFGTKLP